MVYRKWGGRARLRKIDIFQVEVALIGHFKLHVEAEEALNLLAANNAPVASFSDSDLEAERRD